MSKDLPNVPLAEATIVAFLEPLGIVDLPVTILSKQLGYTTIRRLRAGLAEADGINPIYILEKGGSLPLLLGPASIGVTALDYDGWASFQNDACKAIEDALKVCQRSPVSILFRYVDLFSDPAIVATNQFRTNASFCGLTPQISSFHGDFVLAEHVSTGSIRIEPDRDQLKCTFEITTQSDDFTSLSKWFEAAHHEHKRYLWSVLTEQYRQASPLFDELEREEFKNER